MARDAAVAADAVVVAVLLLLLLFAAAAAAAAVAAASAAASRDVSPLATLLGLNEQSSVVASARVWSACQCMPRVKAACGS